MPTNTEPIEVRSCSIGGYEGVIVRAGRRGVTHIVPPAGEKYAFDRQEWARRVEVSVSPTGRSVRVWVDGQEIRNGGGDESGCE